MKTNETKSVDNGLPEGWVNTKLDEIAIIIQGQSPPSSTYNKEGIGLPFFQGKAEFTELYPTTRIWTAAPKKIAEPKDILLSVRAPVGSVNIANLKCSIGRGLAAIRFHANNKFLFYYFKMIENELEKKGSGTTFRAISGQVIKNITVPVPPLQEQNRIVAKIDELLSELEKGIEQLEVSLGQLKTYRHAIEKRLFSEQNKIESNTNDKKNVELGELLDFVGSGATPKGGRNVYVDEGVLFIRSQNVYPNELILDNAAHITKEMDENLKRSRVKEDDVLLNITGASIGRCAYVPKNFPDANVNQHVCILRVNKKRLDFKYLTYYLNSFRAQTDIMNIQSGATRQGLNYGQIRSLQIPMCDLDKQKEIAQKMEIVNTSVRALEKSINQQLSKSNSLVQALLKKAFDGKLVERDVDDEPVELLLERLRSQKETYISNEKRRSKERINYIKELTMSEKLRTIVEILNESDEPVSAKKLWESSVHKDDIDAFYAQLKVHIEKGEIQEMPRENKESYLAIVDKK